MNDGELIQRSLDEPAMFETIFERHYHAVVTYASRRVGANAGEDVASQTFVLAFDRRARFDAVFRSARPWLFGIATNLVRHHVRDERTHLAALIRIPIDAPAGPVDDPARLDAERLRPAIAEALLALSDPDRETFLLVALGELSYEETATALGIPIGTVRSRVNRARTQLRERLPREAATEGVSNDPGDADG
jgi:RNA polymerase sigma-70 factor (ECF subfamily)